MDSSPLTQRITDSFLLTHRITDFLFDIGCRFSPISIRDQMIRGFLITDRLQRANLISESKALLVIGAGVAGATAALVAAERNIPVTLVDRAGRPFLRQAGATRYISPTLYDWPARHWSNLRFPPPSSVKLPLPWIEGKAASIATTWIQKLTAKEEKRKLDRRRNANLSPLTIIMHCEAMNVEALRKATPNANGTITVAFKDVHPDRTKPRREFDPAEFNVIVGCSGPGKEICKAPVGDFEALAFWEADTLNLENYGLPNQNAKVLLSGGGDGALQDLIRLMTTCDSPRDILHVLPPKARRSLVSQIRAAEDVYLRSFLWEIAKHDCRSNYRLDSIHKVAVNSILDQYGSRIQKSLDVLLRPSVLENRISMVHPCQHFTNSYSINRAVAHLLIEFVRRRYSFDLVQPFTTVQKVWSPKHHCKTDHDACSKSSHMVQFATARCQHVKDKALKPLPRPENPTSMFDLIILRHGVSSSDLFGERPYGNYRQVLPYHIDRDWY